MSISRKIIKVTKRFTPRCAKEWLKSSLQNSFTCDYRFLNDSHGNSYVQIDNENQLFTTEKAGIDFDGIFNHDAEEVSSFINIARGKSCFFDVGASRGVYSSIFTKINSNGISCAFEGATLSCLAIKELAEKNFVTDRIKVNECMVGDHDGKDFFSLENCGYIQVLENESIEKVEKKIITLDSFCTKNSLTPDIIKIDVEGYELEVIRGAQTILEKYSPIILLELHLSYLDRRGIFPHQILNLLTDKNYKLYTLAGKPIGLSKINSSIKSNLHLIARHYSYEQ